LSVAARSSKRRRVLIASSGLQRIVAVAWRPSGDFEMRLDSEDVIVGSRRYKTAVSGIGA
jgi:hypothetical protein